MTAFPDDDRISMTCCDCGREFLALGEWQVRCRTCYRAFKEVGDLATLQADLAALQAENDQLRADLDALRRDRDRLRVEAMRAKLQAAPAGRPAIPPAQWRRLLQLVHPDRHANSPAATEATRWLLEQRP
jgi:hypothetical protein